MQVQNLQPRPVFLGDGKWIGAAGSGEDVREYQRDDLAENDAWRLKNGYLKTIASTPVIAPDNVKTEDRTEKSASSKIGGKR